MPFVEVTIGGSKRRLLFDTGNMVGLALATDVLDELDLPVIGQWERLDSGGRPIGTYRQVRAPSARLLGRTLTDPVVFESSDHELDGLVGPDLLPGTRFTLDYGAGLLAVSDSPLENPPRDLFELPLTRSARHPRLILATGRVNGRPVLIEFDTGASRTVIDPELVRDLVLPVAPDGVRIDSLELGPRVFTVPAAKVVAKSGIDSTLSPPIQLSVGSDLLAQWVLTVDYAAGRMFLRDARRP